MQEVKDGAMRHIYLDDGMQLNLGGPSKMDPMWRLTVIPDQAKPDQIELAEVGYVSDKHVVELKKKDAVIERLAKENEDLRVDKRELFDELDEVRGLHDMACERIHELLAEKEKND